MRFQIVSDVHLEFEGAAEKMPEIQKESEILCLLGDIGYPSLESYRNFLFYQASRFQHVLVIAGNHEFYSNEDKPETLEQNLLLIYQICSERDNLYFLHQSSLTLPSFPNLKIIGTTLWSRIPNKHSFEVMSICNDYFQIFTQCSNKQLQSLGNNKFDEDDEFLATLLKNNNAQCDNIDHINNYRSLVESKMRKLEEILTCEKPKKKINSKQQNILHRCDLSWIKHEINQATENHQNVLVLTHHAPTEKDTLTDDENFVPVKYVNCTDLDELFVDPVKAWCFGHTHKNSSHKYGDCFVASNQLGYVGNYSKHFNPSFVIDI